MERLQDIVTTRRRRLGMERLQDIVTTRRRRLGMERLQDIVTTRRRRLGMERLQDIVTTRRRRLGMERLQDIVTTRRRKMAGHIRGLQRERPAHTAMHWVHEDGSRKRGRPKKTWRSTFKEDLEERGVSWRGAAGLPVTVRDGDFSSPDAA